MNRGTIVIIAGIVVALSVSGLAVAISATPDGQGSAAASDSVQADGGATVTAEGVSADEMAFHDVEITNATVQLRGEGNQTQEALQRAVVQQTGANVEGAEVGNVNLVGVSDADVSVDVDEGTATVTATVERVEVQDVRADVIRWEGSGGEMQGSQLHRAFQSENVTFARMTVENFNIESVTVELPAETETPVGTETQTETEMMTETETMTVTETDSA